MRVRGESAPEMHFSLAALGNVRLVPCVFCFLFSILLPNAASEKIISGADSPRKRMQKRAVVRVARGRSFLTILSVGAQYP